MTGEKEDLKKEILEVREELEIKKNISNEDRNESSMDNIWGEIEDEKEEKI